jgi:hypothetical protein
VEAVLNVKIVAELMRQHLVALALVAFVRELALMKGMLACQFILIWAQYLIVHAKSSQKIVLWIR